MARVLFIQVLLILSSLVSAFDVRGIVQWNQICPSYDLLGSAKVTLDSGRLYGSVTRNGSFTIPDVAPGTYVLSVLSHDYVFDQMRVDVLEEDSIPEVKSHIPGTPLISPTFVNLPYPIQLTPRRKNSYFVPRESFNIVGMFQNPMMLIMVLTAAMMLVVPYIMKNMDPQALEELKDRQAKVANFQSSMQSGDIKSGLSSLLSAEDESRSSASTARPQASATTQQRKGGKGSKRR